MIIILFKTFAEKTMASNDVVSTTSVSGISAGSGAGVSTTALGKSASKISSNISIAEQTSAISIENKVRTLVLIALFVLLCSREIGWLVIDASRDWKLYKLTRYAGSDVKLIFFKSLL